MKRSKKFYRYSTPAYGQPTRSQIEARFKDLKHMRAAASAFKMMTNWYSRNSYFQVIRDEIRAIKRLGASKPINVIGFECHDRGSKFKVEVQLAGAFPTRSELKTLNEKYRREIRAVRQNRRHMNYRENVYAGTDRYFNQVGIRTLNYPRCNSYVHVESGDVVKALKSKKIRDVLRDKRPTTRDNYIGVEIEFCHPDTEKLERTEMAHALYELGLDKFVTLKTDGSIRPNSGDTGKEITVLAKQSEITEVINKLCKYLVSAGAYVNDSCGLHVHLDMRHRDVNRAYNNLVAAQSVLYKMVPASRKSNDYCRPTRGRVFSRSSRAGRYRGVNPLAYREHTTLEVRLHSGTINASKITNWVNLLAAIADAPKLEASPRSVKSLALIARLPDSLVRYVNSRIDRFKAEHSKSKAA